MSFHRTSLQRRLVRIGAVLLLPTSISLAESGPQRFANPYYASVSNEPSTQVVLPTSTTTAWSAAPEPVRGLPRNRLAALGAAVQVAKLDEAYRANVPAVDAVAASPVIANAPSIEPSRFAPAPNAAQIPVVAINAANAPATIKPGYRHDTAVQPVVWMSDAATNTNTAPAAMDTSAAQIGNPLRRMFSSRPDVGGVPVQNAAIGNPLR